MSKTKNFPSVNELGQKDPFGSYYVDPSSGHVFDLSGVKVVSKGVDTIRQLYRGSIKDGVLSLFEDSGLVSFAGKRWHAGRISRDSGYQYKLQNSDLGLVLLIKSYHTKSDVVGPHLKIELSPHFINSYTPEALQDYINELAAHVLDNAVSNQAAVHLRVDVQGWRPADNFEASLHCRSTKVRRYSEIDSVDFASASVRYGRGDSFLFGSAGSLQLAVYNKTTEAKVSDKLDYWRSVWGQSSSYDPDQDVYRIEFRFHHSVIEQFSNGSFNEYGELIKSTDFLGISSHLSGLWQYALNAFKYVYRPGFFHPFWSYLLTQDFGVPSEPYDYKRHYKASDSFSGKNIELMLGNFISLACRHQMTARNTWRSLKKLPFFMVITDYYNERGKSTLDLREHIGELLEERYIRWGRAV